MQIKEGDDNDEICDRLAVDKTEKKNEENDIKNKSTLEIETRVKNEWVYDGG